MLKSFISKLELCYFRAFRKLLPFLIIATLTNQAFAEVNNQFQPFLVNENEPSTFFLIGDIDHRTSLNFERAIGKFGTPSLLILASEGGLVNQALVIANRVNSLGISTYIPADNGCYSACAFIFLAGSTKVADGELGVHQISSADNDLSAGQVTISDIVDVLGDFNVPNELIVNMLRTPPSEMYILSKEEKYKYGYFLRDDSDRNLDNSKSFELMSRDIIIDLNRVWSLSNDSAILSLSKLYAENVFFYGKYISKEEFLEEKRVFAKRWPVRNYVVDGSTLSASCIDKVCNVTAAIRWDASSPERNAQSGGWARFAIEVSFQGEVPVVVSEDGEVLKRD